jgi:protocatechuate 3,4-dioxygenase beta subunit
MKKMLVVLIVLGLLAACTLAETQTAPAATTTGSAPIATATPVMNAVEPTLTQPIASSPTLAPEPDDIYSQMGITLGQPICTGLTPPQTEGPYYKPDTPRSNVFYEDGMPGTRLVLVGYVLDQNCQPLPNVWLDFWQADATGEYDNAGYRLRGHQFTDEQGRYYLDTVLPGLYLSRPIEHLHVKVRPEGGEEVTSQLYFPQQPVEGLTVTLEERESYLVGYFNFVVSR